MDQGEALPRAPGAPQRLLRAAAAAELPHPNACLGCESFLTDATHLDTHRAQLGRTDQMIAKAEEHGWARVAENNQRDRDSLVSIIRTLEQLEDADSPSDTEAADG